MERKSWYYVYKTVYKPNSARGRVPSKVKSREKVCGLVMGPKIQA